ncbi:MAG: hypothetical protein ACJZ44_01905 [Nitrospinales bacterium]
MANKKKAKKKPLAKGNATSSPFHRYGKYSVDQFYEASKVWDRVEDGMQIRRMVKLESRNSLKKWLGYRNSNPKILVSKVDKVRMFI